MNDNVQTYSSYSGADIKIYASLNQAYTRELAERQKTTANQIARDDQAAYEKWGEEVNTYEGSFNINDEKII